jgi:hypothetical protein
MRRKGFFAGVVALGLLGAAGGARAEEGPEDERAKLRAQIEKVLSLMRENEKALLAVSAGQAATPTKPDVPKPQADPDASSQGATAPKKGSDIARELKELVRMWPT